MTTIIEQYHMAKQEQTKCKGWAALLNKPYSGGGGGLGEIRQLSISEGTLAITIYYQERNGDKNYQEMPSSLKPHLEAAIKAKFAELLDDALAIQDGVLKARAKEALDEHSRLMQAAGLAL